MRSPADHLIRVGDVLFVSHREPVLTVHHREGTAWAVREARRHETVTLMGLRRAVDFVYRDALEDTDVA